MNSKNKTPQAANNQRVRVIKYKIRVQYQIRIQHTGALKIIRNLDASEQLFQTFSLHDRKTICFCGCYKVILVDLSNDARGPSRKQSFHHLATIYTCTTTIKLRIALDQTAIGTEHYNQRYIKAGKFQRPIRSRAHDHVL